MTVEPLSHNVSYGSAPANDDANPLLPPHIAAWLAAHPERSVAWLMERRRDGFDVHHLDGDHGNNDPDNLVLMEHSDHMRLHGVRVPSVPLHVLGHRAKREIRQATQAIADAANGHGLLAKLLRVEPGPRRRKQPDEPPRPERSKPYGPRRLTSHSW